MVDKMLKTKKTKIIQRRLNKIIDEIGYNIFELSEELGKDKKSVLARDLIKAADYLASFCQKLEQKEYKFNRDIKIWVESQEEWDEAAWNYITEQEK
jgi:hypothetical protein